MAGQLSFCCDSDSILCDVQLQTSIIQQDLLKVGHTPLEGFSLICYPLLNPGMICSLILLILKFVTISAASQGENGKLVKIKYRWVLLTKLYMDLKKRIRGIASICNDLSLTALN